MRSEKGISSITIAIVIVIVIIVASIIVTGNYGKQDIVKSTVDATESSFHSNVRDALLILQTNYTSKREYYQFLQNNLYIEQDGKVNVKDLLEQTDCEYGIGSNNSDVYILDKNLNLTYYDKTRSAIPLGNLGDTMGE